MSFLLNDISSKNICYYSRYLSQSINFIWNEGTLFIKEMILFIPGYDKPDSSTDKVMSIPEDGIFSSCPISTSSKVISTPNR